MSNNEFITFQKFNSILEAEELIATLTAHEIIFQIEEVTPTVDITFSGNTLHNEIRIKIKPSDFVSANQILEKHAEQQIDEFTEDHYLYQFTNDELIEIIEKPDEWSKEDYLLSQKILKSRGHEIVKEKVEEIRQNRIANLRKPEQGQIGWLIFGFISAIFGGLFGVFIGWFHWRFKKTDPTGQRIYAFNEKTRKRGQVIFWLGLISFIIWAVYFGLSI